ncbi:hypothetical protein TYRP_021867 [Tyrophagus putrescentiae]|nr:hypothetical protein TYRP_021867 [Tyrophagus putrescentiae]
MAKLLQLLEVVFALLAVTSTASGQLSPLTEGLSVLTTPLQREIERHIDTLKPTIGRLLNVSPDTQFSQIFPTISNFNQSQIIECYNSTIGETQFDIFKNTIFDAIKAYYKNFPENFDLVAFPNKVKNFFQSLNEIGTHTVQCLVDPSGFQLGFSPFTDFSDAEYKELLGAKHGEAENRLIMSNFLDRRRTDQRSGRDESGEDSKESRESSESSERSSNETVSSRTTEAPTTSSTTAAPARRSSLLNLGGSSNTSSILGRASGGLLRRRRQQVTVDPICFPKNKSPLPEKFDWQSKGKVTPARFQSSCGSCWAFASLGALESAYLIKGKTNSKKFDLSEQELLGCARKNGCKGGTSVDAFNYILNNDGVTDESSLPYDKKEKCDKRKKKKVAKVEDYCLRGVYAKVNGKPEQLTDEQIMLVVREFGPVYATINADHVAVKHLKSGVYNYKKCPKETNHAVLITGWDKKAWLIKNSWGKKWANSGFFRMKRGSNLCGLNTYITYPIL